MASGNLYSNIHGHLAQQKCLFSVKTLHYNEPLNKATFDRIPQNTHLKLNQKASKWPLVTSTVMSKAI